MAIDLGTFVSDFATCFRLADLRRPQAVNIRSKEAYQVGLGPHGEAQTVKLVTQELQEYLPQKYKGEIGISIPYPTSTRQRCDLCLGQPPVWDWAIEVKMLRLLGDNGKLNDNILMHILSPYPEHRSALTDCEKLMNTKLSNNKAILIYGYDHDEWPLELAIEAFEALSSIRVRLGQRFSERFQGLVHPVHSRGIVCAWQIFPKG